MCLISFDDLQRESVKFRIVVRDDRKRALTFDPKLETKQIIQHMNKWIVVERSGSKREIPKIDGVLIDVIYDKKNLLSAILLLVSNNKIGGTQKKIFLKQIQSITIPKGEKWYLTELLEEYVGS